MYKTLIMPFFDFTVALIGILLLSPILIVATIALFIANQGKPFFLQPRPGKNGTIFTIIKFKTMNDRKEEHCGDFQQILHKKSIYYRLSV